MEKYAFFKYFIKNRVFAGGDGGGSGKPVSIWRRGWVFNIYPRYGLGRGRVHGSGSGDGDA